MKFTFLEMDGSTTLVVYAAACVLVLFIFYWIIKAAVKHGMIEAQEELNRPKKEFENHVKPAVIERPSNPAQWELQQKYDKGEITFEEYKAEWNKLI